MRLFSMFLEEVKRRKVRRRIKNFASECRRLGYPRPWMMSLTWEEWYLISCDWPVFMRKYIEGPYATYNTVYGPVELRAFG